MRIINSELSFDGTDFILPKKELKLTKVAVALALDLVNDYLDDTRDYYLYDDEITFYIDSKNEFEKFANNLDYWDNSVILPLEGLLTIKNIIDFAAECLDDLHVEDIYHKNYKKYQDKYQNNIIDFLTRLKKLYNFDKIINPDDYIQKVI